MKFLKIIVQEDTATSALREVKVCLERIFKELKIDHPLINTYNEVYRRIGIECRIQVKYIDVRFHSAEDKLPDLERLLKQCPYYNTHKFLPYKTV